MSDPTCLEATSDQTVATECLVTALRYLAGVCDGAITLDGHGFNRLDSSFGKSLAEQSLQGSLTPAQQRAALKMVRKYRRQLEGAGLALPDDGALPAVVARPLERRAALRPAGRIRLEGKSLAVTFSYDPRRVERIKAIDGRTPVYDNGRFKHWIVPLAKVDDLLEAFPDFDVDPSIVLARQTAEAVAEVERQMQEAAVQALLEAAGDLSAPFPGGRVLFQHQRQAVERMLRQGKIILADDMGLGKTMSALAAAKAYALPVFVVCPASLRVNWLREAEQVGVAIEVYSWAKLPQAPETDFVLICDEAHYAQSLKAQRTQGMLALAGSQYCRACFLLTGTPIKNGLPVNLFPLLVAVDHALARNRQQYELRYCNAHATEWTRWDTTGAVHLDELNRKTQNAILRRTKKECLDLPAKTRVLRRAELSDEAKREYDLAYKKLRQEYRRRLRAGEIMAGGEALVMLNHLRHAGSIAKAECAIELGQEVIEQGGQVVLFTAFRESADRIGRDLACEVLSGDAPADARQPMIDRFQAGERKALVCTFGAGGLGVTLTAAQTVVLVDRPWTPGDAVQAEDRLHRIGQTANVTAVWLQANGTDEAIDAILEQKAERIQLVLQGKRKTMRGIGTVTEIAAELLPLLMED